MQFSHALLAALVALASAQSSATTSASSSQQSGCSQDIKVQSQSDLDKIAGCKKLDGSIEITGEAGVLSIDGIEEITGSLKANNLSTLNSLTAPKLTSVGKDLDLQVLNGLSTLSFPALQAVGNLKWITLPNLDVMQLNQGVNNATSVVISDTSIKELMGINVVDVGEVNINNNRYLKQIALGLQHVTESLQISDNAPGLEAQFDSLQWAANISFRGVSKADMPNLTYVNNSIGYVNNTIKNISLPQLTKVGGGIFFVSNSELTDLKVPELEEIGGGLQVANNTKLRKVDGFPKVKSVAGAIEMLGNFSEATPSPSSTRSRAVLTLSPTTPASTVLLGTTPTPTVTSRRLLPVLRQGVPDLRCPLRHLRFWFRLFFRHRLCWLLWLRRHLCRFFCSGLRLFRQEGRRQEELRQHSARRRDRRWLRCWCRHPHPLALSAIFIPQRGVSFYMCTSLIY